MARPEVARCSQPLGCPRQLVVAKSVKLRVTLIFQDSCINKIFQEYNGRKHLTRTNLPKAGWLVRAKVTRWTHLLACPRQLVIAKCVKLRVTLDSTAFLPKHGILAAEW